MCSSPVLSSDSFFARLRYGTGLLFALALVVGGCSGANLFSGDDEAHVQEGDLAERHLPTTRRLVHHPDSVEALAIKSDGDQLVYESELDNESIVRKWSATFQNVGTGRTVRQPLSYATLWSLERVLASLQNEGTQELTEGRAQEIIDKQRADYHKTIQIDVVWFASEGNPELTGPSARTRLVVGGEKYKPTREEWTPLRETVLGTGQTENYRRNIFAFKRIVDGEDILDGASSIKLEIVPINTSERIRFRWEWGKIQAGR